MEPVAETPIRKDDTPMKDSVILSMYSGAVGNNIWYHGKIVVFIPCTIHPPTCGERKQLYGHVPLGAASVGSVANASGNTGSVLVGVSSVHIIGVGNQLLRHLPRGVGVEQS